MLPNVAFITAAYNANQTICEAIQSVGAQDYTGALRHYICDDASTDNTVEKILSLMNDGFITTTYFDYVLYEGKIGAVDTFLIAAKKNRRQGVARNHCVRAAWSWADAFAILDADDIKYVNWTTRHVEEWLRDPESIVVVYSDYDSRGEDGIVIREYKHSYNKDRLHRECIVSSGALASKVVFQKGGLYMEDTYCVEDYGQWLKASNFGIMIHIPESLWQYRATGSNSTNSANMDKIRAGHQTMGQNYQNWLKNPVGYNA